MANEGAQVATGVFGGITCCILVCMFTFGLPMLIAGVTLLTTFKDFEPTRTAGLVCVILSCVMILVGIITSILTCVCAAKSVNGYSRRNDVHPGGTVVMAPMAPGVQQPMVYTSTGYQQQQPIYTSTVAQGPVPPPYGATYPQPAPQQAPHQAGQAPYQAPQAPYQAPQPGQSAYPDNNTAPPSYDYTPPGVATKSPDAQERY